MRTCFEINNVTEQWFVVDLSDSFINAGRLIDISLSRLKRCNVVRPCKSTLGYSEILHLLLIKLIITRDSPIALSVNQSQR